MADPVGVNTTDSSTMVDAADVALIGAPRRFVLDRALATVMANLAPAPFVILPFCLLVSTLMRNDVSSRHLGWWLLMAVACTGITLLALYRYYRVSERRIASGRPGLSVFDQLLIATSFCTIGVTFGMTPWVAEGSPTEVVLMFALFPATAGAMGCVVTAGRRDMFLAMSVPLIAGMAWTLLIVDDTRLHGLGLLSLLYGASLLALHFVLSRNGQEAINLQWRSDQLLRALDHERGELTSVNATLAATNTRLAHQATHDPLTGLYNRRGTLELLEAVMADCTPSNPVGLLFCDLDRFKAVNDALGHRGGDRFITVIAERIQHAIGPHNVAGRMGGDEFVVVMPDHNMEAAAGIAHRLVAVLAQPVYAEGREMPSSVSIGVATAPQHGSASSELLRNANAALYRAKGAGRNRVELFDSTMHEEMISRLETEQALRRAIDDGEIIAFFQPELDATTGHLVGAELLARWVRRDGRIIAATEFLAVANSSNLLERITERVITSARPHMRRLSMLGLPDGFRFRVNMAPEATERSWRDDPIERMLHGIAPDLVTIDVLESSVGADSPSAAANLASFRARGGRVCLDDFAHGVSSLNLLRRLPLDEVRIDRMAIDTLAAHPHDRAIVRSIIALVREIGLSVTADGVETGAQADALIALGCVRQQGHLYAPALPAGEFEDYLVGRMAAQFVERSFPQPTWETEELT